MSVNRFTSTSQGHPRNVRFTIAATQEFFHFEECGVALGVNHR
jgi:hypothetical protein